jgi:phosphoglycerate dehydrogenase-like enzyme
MPRLRGMFILDETACPMIYGPEEHRDIARRVEIVAPPQTRETLATCRSLLREADVIFSGWGAPVMDEAFLKAAPKLKAVFYGSGSVGGWITPAVWERGIAVSSAYVANAVPVAEYALSVILFSLKHGWTLARQTRQRRTFVPRDGAPGCYGSTVGLVSLGTTARMLLRLLRPFDLRVLVYDPHVTETEAAELGVELVPLDELFRRSDAVSLHTPHLAETQGLIGAELLGLMKPGASFVNTARGQIVREDELIEVARRREDLQFVLDVTCQEPPPADSPLYTLANVVLTPHIAGSVGAECRRMGRYMVEELERFVDGKPLRWAVTPELAAHSSHRPVARERPPEFATHAAVACPTVNGDREHQ